MLTYLLIPLGSMRKSKLVFFYEFVVQLKWKGTTKDGVSVTGTVDIPNISEENEASDIEVHHSRRTLYSALTASRST